MILPASVMEQVFLFKLILKYQNKSNRILKIFYFSYFNKKKDSMGLTTFIQKLIPPAHWRVPVIVLLAIFCGLGLYTFYISKAHSYLSDNPSTCVNCHIMAPQYTTWSHSAHREQAHCNDCHVPQDNIFSHYFFKAKDGLRHATIFTLRNEPQVIHIKEAGRDVVHQNCVRCHQELLVDPKTARISPMHEAVREGRLCWECHRTVPHGRVNSLSSTPNARVPLPKSPVPDWLKDIMNEDTN